MPSYTFTAEPVGAADADRSTVVVVCGIQNSATTGAAPTVTINGNAAILDGWSRPRTTATSSRALCGIYRLANPTGTTADIVVTFPVAMYDCTIFVYSVLNIASVRHVDVSVTTTAFGSPLYVRHVPVDTVDGGTVIFGSMVYDVSTSPTLSGVSEDAEVIVYSNDRRIVGHQDITTGSETYDVAMDLLSDEADCWALLAVSYSPDPAPDLDVRYVGQNQQTGSASTFTFTSEPVGDADADRSTVVVVNYIQNGTATTPPTMTIGGASATCDASVFGGLDTTTVARSFSGIFRLANPTGTTATIVLSLSTAAYDCVIDVYAVIGIDSVVDTGSATGTSLSTPFVVAADLDTVDGGAVIAGAMSHLTSTSDIDGTFIGTTKNSYFDWYHSDVRHTASSEVLTGETPRSLDYDLTSSPESYAVVTVSYAPVPGEDACLANDVISASSVTNPAVHQTNALLANDVISTSSVSQPAVHQTNVLLANDILSASSVSQPAVHQGNALLANDVTSASSVSQPLAEEIQPSIPVPSPVPPAHGGSGAISGGARYFGKEQRERLAELIERAYRQALRIEPEVAEAIREAVKEAIPERRVRTLRTEDFARLAASADAARSLLERIERTSKAVRITEALDMLILNEQVLEEDDIEVLMLVA